MFRKIFTILKEKLSFWRCEVCIATKMYLYFFPPRFYLPVWVVRAISEIIFFTLIGYTAGGKEGGYFALIGNCVLLVGRSIFNRGSGIIVREKWMGTLQYVVVSSFKFIRYIIGRNALNFVEGFVSSTILFYVLGSGFGLFKENYLVYLWYIPVILIIALSMTGLSTIIAGITFYSRTSVYLTSTINIAIMIFCGVTIPITVLPDVMQKISYFMPVTNGLLAIRDLLTKGGLSFEFFIYLLREITIGAFYLLIGTFILKLMIRIGLRKGTLETF